MAAIYCQKEDAVYGRGLYAPRRVPAGSTVLAEVPIVHARGQDGARSLPTVPEKTARYAAAGMQGLPQKSVVLREGLPGRFDRYSMSCIQGRRVLARAPGLYSPSGPH